MRARGMYHGATALSVTSAPRHACPPHLPVVRDTITPSRFDGMQPCSEFHSRSSSTPSRPFLLAGFVKGFIGLGLPTIATGILTVVMAPGQAAGLLRGAELQHQCLAGARRQAARRAGAAVLADAHRHLHRQPAGRGLPRPRHFGARNDRARHHAHPLCNSVADDAADRGAAERGVVARAAGRRRSPVSSPS